MAAFELVLSQARRHCSRLHPTRIHLFLSSSSSLQSPRSAGLGFSRSTTLLDKPSIFYGTNSTSSNSFLRFHRSFCTSSSSSSDTKSEARTDESVERRSQSAPLKTVSYPVKPKDPSSAEEELSKQTQTPVPRRPRETERTFVRQTETDSEPAKTVEPRSWTREDFRYVKDVPSISPVSYPVKVAPLPEDRLSVSAEEAPKEEVEKKEDTQEDRQLEQERRRIEADVRMRRVLRVGEEEKLPFPTVIKVEKQKQKVVLDLQEAIREVKANAKRNFIETVEAHVKLGVDPRRGDQMVRGAASLPHGTGKVVRVAVFAEGAAADEARAAGADIVGADELIEEIKNSGGKLNFDKCIATPLFMPRLGKIARILGPRGLMPNPKLGSVTSDVTGAVQEAKRGRIDFKIDKTAIVHVGLGKVNFSEEYIRENVGAFVNALLLAKPVGLKKTSKYAGYVNSFTLCSTMGPGFPVSIQSLSLAADHFNRSQVK
ncbi:50S ribosomal protein L1, chloroplastic [Telopea speciosissima]|uniref:50S ribosomal protein L1, chloroplastic n=1 Tax=Telopea speciosissima TaxID=54955 RepID=UPI001CC771F5|nr:50S ribosomal protein L1, chloroplastic [Telopea speciosissima]